MPEKRYWLMKSEPNAYSFTDLMNEEEGAAEWDGVRNYQARNIMRDDMKIGDGVIFYHSNAKPPGAVGIAEIVREGYPDFTAWDPAPSTPTPRARPTTQDGTWWTSRRSKSSSASSPCAKSRRLPDSKTCRWSRTPACPSSP